MLEQNFLLSIKIYTVEICIRPARHEKSETHPKFQKFQIAPSRKHNECLPF